MSDDTGLVSSCLRDLCQVTWIPHRSAALETADSLSAQAEEENNWLIQLASLHSYIPCNPGFIIV